MRRLCATIFLSIACILLQAQEDYSAIDRAALAIPLTNTWSTSDIAGYVNLHFPGEKDKIRAIYTWITHNVEYSKDSMFQFRRWGVDPEEKMAAILRRRKGVCENYAELFANIVSKCGIRAVAITGYTKFVGPAGFSGHGWAAVKSDKEWLLCDPTWDVGKPDYHYFLVSPQEFIATHMPFDPLWQLLPQPLTHREFRRGYTSAAGTGIKWNITDSVDVYLRSDTLQQMESVARRMKAAGLENDELKTWYSYNQMKINIVLQEENMQWYNDAVAQLNEAKKLYNEFVQFRNNGFTPAKTDKALTNIFSSIDTNLSAAKNKMEMIGTKAENYQYDTDALKTELDRLTEKVTVQKQFLLKYLQSTPAERQRLQ